MIVFINCYEEMATGMRILAAMAREKGFAVHICVVQGYSVVTKDTLDESTTSMHICVNGTFHVNQLRGRPFSAGELTSLQTKLQQLNPELICISTRSANDDIMPDMLRCIRDTCPGVPIICGGYGPTYAPEHYLRHGADMVLRGEGEISFAALLDSLPLQSPLLSPPHHIPNACYLDNGNMARTPMAAPLRDISALPSPLTGDAVTTFIHDDSVEERDPAFDDTTFYILTGRGCIGACAYCAAPVLGGMYKKEGHILPRYRRRSDEQVLRELEQARAQGVQRIFFKDEYLVDEPRRLTAFFRQYQERIGLPFRANLHHEQLLRHPELLDAALDAGMYGYSIGFQAGMERMARHVYGRPHRFTDFMTLAQILFEQFVVIQFHFVSGTSLNSDEEFEAKCALMASLPYDPVAPWRTLCMDFQFFPQPLSRLTQNLDGGKLQRLPVRTWAGLALRAQLRHFATEEEIRQTEEEISQLAREREVDFLQTRSRELRAKRLEEYCGALARDMAGRDVLVMGEATPDYAARCQLLADSRIVGRIAFPGHAAETGRIDASRIAGDYDPSMPIIMFGSSYSRFARHLRRQYRVGNPLYGVRM
ncbi:MAG: cobalamin-dependent protein [Desulfovibrionaceae bacterium]|nr:cobalamin-dependent protein [Desulfovibrionaceae bacterium]